MDQKWPVHIMKVELKKEEMSSHEEGGRGGGGQKRKQLMCSYTERGSRGRESQSGQRRSLIVVTARLVELHRFAIGAVFCQDKSVTPAGHMSAKSQRSKKQHRQ